YIAFDGRKTSVSLEDAFWNIFKEIAHRRQTTISELASAINSTRRYSNLSSAIRLFVLTYYRGLVSEHENRDK
ncbi:ribbon-helix-helix domain-containing protein, partial [Salmonella sp. SAL4448]|uniref:ribbon-helix-helix domain-containing protein n=1 Tax=Salmonella sp. SAL4448 TaxID=3159903 RepID=UPI00397BA3D6